MDVPAVPDPAPPLVVDIDGTLTDDARELDARVFPVLRAWPAPVVVATGKALPFPVALCEFLAIDIVVIAENGGIALDAERESLHVEGDREAARAVVEEYRSRGYDLGWGKLDLANRWRETEIIARRSAPLAPLEEIAADHGLEVVDTGFAYHVKPPERSKGKALERIGTELDIPLSAFAAVGDSINDASVFQRVGRAVAVGNADDAAVEAADHVTSARYAEGFLEAVAWLDGEGVT